MTVLMFLIIVGIGFLSGSRFGLAIRMAVSQSYKALVAVMSMFVAAWLGGILGLVAASFREPAFTTVEELAEMTGQGMLAAVLSVAAGIVLSYVRPGIALLLLPERKRRNGK